MENLLIMLLCWRHQTQQISSLAVGLMDDDFREALKDATDVDQIIDIFKSKKEE